MSKNSNPLACVLSNNLYWIIGLLSLALAIFLPKQFNEDFVDSEITNFECIKESLRNNRLEVADSTFKSPGNSIIVSADYNTCSAFAKIIKSTAILLMVLFIYSCIRFNMITATSILISTAFATAFSIAIMPIVRMQFSALSSLMIIVVAVYSSVSNIALPRVDQDRSSFMIPEARYQSLIWILLVASTTIVLGDISIIPVASGVLANELYFSRYISMVSKNLSKLFGGS